MTVTVMLFASYADALGTQRLSLSLPERATVRDVIAQLEQLPGADRLPPHPLVAVNESYARSSQPLSAGDEVAIIPPVAGG